MNADGSGQSNITNNPGLFDGAPAWSPDGQKITFYADPCSGCGTNVREIYAMNADGTGRVRLTNNDVDDLSPAWSADGSKIVFEADADNACTGCNREIYTMNADGTDRTRLTTNPGFDGQPAWSPDGSKIAFASVQGGNYEIYVMNTDGSGQTNVTTNGAADFQPAWSPDGGRIAFESHRDEINGEIYTMNADGSEQTRLTSNVVIDSAPAWSPDGTKITFASRQHSANTNDQIYVMNADGGNQVRITSNLGSDSDPDWQPLGNYPRPQGATPIRVSLVAAFKQCSDGEGTIVHGPPLAYSSCALPAQASGYLTVGTPDANGRSASSIGSARFGAIVGNPITPEDEADLSLTVGITDIRNRGDLLDYAGELQAAVTIRITDKLNGPSSTLPATVADFTFSWTVPCTVPPGAIGSACSVATTADALMAGAIREGKRAIWKIGQVQVFDGGADGIVSTGPNTLFARQGIFVP